MQAILANKTTWYLIAKQPEDGVPPRIAITPPFRIGRREGFDLCLSCRNVSGLHAELLQDQDQLWVEDLNSTNGTFVNGARVRKKTTLKDGDTVQFGQTTFTIACVGDSNDAPGENVDAPVAATPAPETTEERFERLLKNGVTPFFQPIYNIAGDSKQRIGYEVLGRSRLFGLKTPDQMFAIATDLEKESELSRTLRLRGIEAAESTFPTDMMLFVNTHPAEMDCDEIKNSLREIRAQFPNRQIMLELSEQVLYTSDGYSELIDAVKELGVQLVLHDFGAGQIRLAELAALGPDVVKFDGALIQGIDKADEKRIKLVTAMVKMVTQLDITPMAEYVETEGEHDKLKELGFELVQGFFYGHPTDIESLVEGVENGDEVESVEVADSAEVMAEANRGPQERPVDALKNLDESADETTSSESPEATSPEAAATPSSATPSYNDDQWLMDKDSESYTIQLMFTATKDAAETFLSERSVPGEYSIYRKWSSNREWFVVVFGTFNDRFEAQSAIEQFGDTGHSSWVRKMESVKEEIKSIDDN